MIARRKRSIRVNAGDVFEIPVPDGRRGYGQVIVPGTAFYIAVFRDLYRDRVDLSELVKGEILLVGWTLDALIYHGTWKIIGACPPVADRVPFPSYKVGVNSAPHVHDFKGENYRPATPDEWELLDYKSTVAPVAYQNALLAYHGLRPWREDYQELTVEHAQRRVLKAEPSMSRPS